MWDFDECTTSLTYNPMIAGKQQNVIDWKGFSKNNPSSPLFES